MSVAGRRSGKLRPAGIVGADSKAQKLGRNPACKVAVGCYERGVFALGRDRMPERDGDDERFIALGGGFHQGDASECRCDIRFGES